MWCQRPKICLCIVLPKMKMNLVSNLLWKFYGTFVRFVLSQRFTLIQTHLMFVIDATNRNHTLHASLAIKFVYIWIFEPDITNVRAKTHNKRSGRNARQNEHSKWLKCNKKIERKCKCNVKKDMDKKEHNTLRSKECRERKEKTDQTRPEHILYVLRC